MAQLKEHSWIHEFPGSITVCDRAGIIVEMNEQSARAYAAQGGLALLGKNMLDCHPEPARSKVEQMLKAGEKHIDTVEKDGVKRLIYQTPFFVQGEYAGFMELGLEIPSEIPHFIRS